MVKLRSEQMRSEEIRSEHGARSTELHGCYRRLLLHNSVNKLQNKTTQPGNVYIALTFSQNAITEYYRRYGIL